MEEQMAQPDLVGIVVRDMAASLKFYRLLGLNIPSTVDSEPHVEFVTPGGFRIVWDSLDMMKGIYPEWGEAVGHRMTFAFKCDNPGEVNALYESLVKKGYQGYKAPWDAFWGQRYAVITD